MKSVLTSFLNAKEVKKARLKLGDFEREKQEIVGTLNELFGKKVGALTMQERQQLTRLCYLFKRAYIDPYYEPTRVGLASMEIYDNYIPVLSGNNKDLLTYGEFFNSSNIVKVYLGFLQREETLQKEVVSVILNIFNTISHEYRHNFQFKAVNFSSANNVKANALIDKYARLISNQTNSWMVDANQIDAVQHLLRARDHYEETNPEKLRKYNAYDCALAFSAYLNDYTEMDARDAELEFLKRVVEDVLKYSPVESGLKQYVQGFYKTSVGNEKQSRKYYSSYFKNYEKIMNSISKEDYVEYAKLLKETFLEEYFLKMGDVKNAVENGNDAIAALDESYIRQYNTDILKRSFKFILQDFTFNKARVVNADENLYEYFKRVNNLGLLFLKYGLNNASELLEQEVKNKRIDYNGLVASYQSMIEEYYSMLKDGDVTLDSFTRFKDIPIDKQLEIFTDYIRQGKIEFCRQILLDLDNPCLIERRMGPLVEGNENNLKKLLLNSVLKKPQVVCNGLNQQTILPLGPKRREFSILDEIYKRLNYLSERQGRGTLVYDDIDEMISLIADMCLSLKVPYYKRKEDLEERDTLEEQEIQDRLYDLYEYAENIGYDKVCTILGRNPGLSEYRYAHAGDREPYVLKGKDYYNRFKKIYGKTAYEDLIRAKKNLDEIQAELNSEAN